MSSSMDLWYRGYQQAKKYYSRHGDINVSSSFVDEDGYSLGRWLSHQRNKFNGTDAHETALSSKQIQDLNSIGMIWDKLEYQWNAYYQSAHRYYNTNGDLLVPVSYIDENGLKLGQWICAQRRYYFGKAKRGMITSERINKLEAIGMTWDPLSVQWEANYTFAKQFFEENGHLFIPKNYVTENGTKLDKWIQNQRSKYHHHGDGQLTQDQITRLNHIGMSWNPYDEEWMKNYFLAKKYYDKHGNLLVPLRYSNESEPNLGAWISRQRKRINGKSGKPLTSHQESLLNSIGMIWNPNEVYFEECMIEAKDYYDNVGDLEIDNSYVSPTGKNLGFWIANLRKSYKSNALSEEKIKRLEDIGMIWEIKDSASQTSFPEQIVLYYVKSVCSDVISRFKDFGFELDIYIPSIRVGIEYDGAAWHKHKQAADNEKNLLCKKNNIVLYRLREEKCPQLNGISIDINVGKYTIQNVLNACVDLFSRMMQTGYISTVPEIKFSSDICEIRKNYKNAKNESWALMYREAEKYYYKHGNLEIPFDYTTENGLKLGTWITNQRSNYAGYSGVNIDQSRIMLLEKIGMIWNVPDSQWKKGYEEAKQYYLEHGDLRVHAHYVSNSGYRLGAWISKQRGDISLSIEQKELLDELGMIWNTYDEKWEIGINEAENYYSEHGNLRVPAGYITVSGFTLGNWIATQRSKYKAINGEKPLSIEQIQKLESIKMIWDVFADAWQQGYTHAKEYYINFGHLLVPSNYICEDGYTLGHWIQNKRSGYNDSSANSKPSIEQIQKLEQIGMVWDVEDYNWKKNYCLAKEYYNTHGNLHIPQSYETEDGERLGLWIRRQRRMFSGKTNKKLSTDRIALLNEIGMIWS
jgi:hypothetical protein